LRFLAVSITVLTLIAAASGQQAPAAKKKTAAAASAKTKTVPHTAAAPGTTGSAKASLSKKAPVSKSVASKTAASKTTSKTASKTGVKSRRTVVARRPPAQQQPTADRYKEIQQALAEKGYFQGPVDGSWNAGSVEALKRFQKDQNLDSDGKIGSLSLIALGLGPKRGETAAQAVIKSTDEPLPPDSPPVTLPQQ
jgi:murein L,D-transpeptidase YcbB/YkuD